MNEDEDARRARAEHRRQSWTVERLTSEKFARSQPWPGGPIGERLERLEALRQISFGLAGIEYPEGPTPKHERERWPLERIG